jgi:hypothetical protein
MTNDWQAKVSWGDLSAHLAPRKGIRALEPSVQEALAKAFNLPAGENLNLDGLQAHINALSGNNGIRDLCDQKDNPLYDAIASVFGFPVRSSQLDWANALSAGGLQRKFDDELSTNPPAIAHS